MKFKKLLLVGAMAFISSTLAEVIIFDCGGVLTNVSKRKSLGFLGLGNLLPRLFANNFSTMKMRVELMNELERLMPLEQQHIGIFDEFGNQLPGILCQWMLGEKTNKELLHMIECFVSTDEQLQSCPSKKKALLALTRNMLNEHIFVETLYLEEKVIQFLEACARMKQNNTKRHKIYILSNYNKEAFELLLERFPRIKNNIDGYFVSGIEGKAKPHENCFDAFFAKFNINPSSEVCYFIDDQPENRIVGSKKGLICVHPHAIERKGDDFYLWVPH